MHRAFHSGAVGQAVLVAGVLEDVLDDAAGLLALLSFLVAGAASLLLVLSPPPLPGLSPVVLLGAPDVALLRLSFL